MAKGKPTRAAGDRPRRDLALLLFLVLLGSYAYLWQSRDWNSASRLMLSYALVDRHRVDIDGLEQQAGQPDVQRRGTGRPGMVAGDLAQFGGHYYTDKAPGQSLLGVPIYAIARTIGRLPGQPIDRAAMAYWPADYFVTLGTSGVLTALVGVVLYAFSLRLGASHLGGVLVGLAYGLGTPAFVYATLFYAHQAAAFCTLASFFLLYRAAHEGRAGLGNMLLSGLLAGYAVVLEYPVALVSAVIAAYAVLAVRRMRPVLVFGIAALGAASVLAAYNYRAFGSPFELGYAHEVFPMFRAVHSDRNPLGVRVPAWDTMRPVLAAVLWGRYRGLAFYAPAVLLALPGLVALVARKFYGVASVIVLASGAMLLVNIGYPLWEGGWCTGPRLLVPAIPFLMLAVAGLVAATQRALPIALLAVASAAGGVLMLGCVAVGGRFAPAIADPVRAVVVPHWRGQIELGHGEVAGGRQFEWNAGRWLLDHALPQGWKPAEPSPWRALEFAPLLLFQLLLAGVLLWRARGDPPTARSAESPG